jgi:hypothetical protein
MLIPKQLQQFLLQLFEPIVEAVSKIYESRKRLLVDDILVLLIVLDRCKCLQNSHCC